MIPPTTTAPETLDTVDLRVIDLLCGFVDANPHPTPALPFRRGGKENELTLPPLQGRAGVGSLLRTVLTALCEACEEGSLCLPVDETFLEAAKSGHYASILGASGDPKPLILQGDRLYFHRHFHAEKSIAEGLKRMLSLGPIPCDSKTVESILCETLEEKPLRNSDSLSIQLTEKQQQALNRAMRERVFLLTGGPGTGKTALTTSLLRALIRLRNLDPKRIRLCAPTGRAAQRLQELLHHNLSTLDELSSDSPDAKLLQIQVETLHRMLGYHPSSGRFARHPGDPLQADVVLLDEASMADAFTLAALIKALPPEAALILVGDADQLPAVGAGSVLGELLPTDRATGGGEIIPTVILDRSHRSQQSLLDLAEAINRGDAETALQAPRISAPNDEYPSALPGLLDRYAQSVFLDQRVQGKTYPEWLEVARNSADPAVLSVLMGFLNSERILACTRHGGLGCEKVNTLLRRKLEPIFEERSSTRPQFGAFHGAPILITRNDTRTGLSNGEVGIWLRDDTGLTAHFQRGGEWLHFAAAFLPSWELAFATTVHKSQGSECDAVLLILAEAGNRLLTREILYTAVTRARKSVKIFGSEAALREALENRVARYGGLRGYF